MSINYERDEREWRRQQRNQEEDDYGWGMQGRQARNWRDENDMNQGYREERMQRGGNWQRDRGWDRGNPGNWQGNWQSGWQGGRGGGWEGDRWEGGGRYENRNDWNQGMGGRWNQGNWSHEMQGQHAGRGPRNYKRQDDRIEEDINEQLTRHPMIDASDIEVNVQSGEVTLRGHVDSRQAKRMAEDIAESVYGVKEINNQIKIQYETETSGKQRKAS